MTAEEIIIYERLIDTLKTTNAVLTDHTYQLYWDGTQWRVTYRGYRQKHDRVLYTGEDFWEALNTFRTEMKS